LETLGEQADTKEFNIIRQKVIRLGRTNSTFNASLMNQSKRKLTKEKARAGAVEW